jgi:ATP-dependent helicase/nuclease subunit A
LEFNAVVFVDWARDARKSRGETAFVDRRTGLLHVRAGSRSEGTQLLTPGYEDAAAREGRFGEAEERRLDYVAATRARDLLVLPRMAEAGENSLAETLAEVEAAARSVETVRVDPAEERRRFRRRPPAEAAAPELGPDYDEWKRKLSEELERAGVPEAVIAATALARLEEEEVPREFEEAPPSRPDALKLGSALHAVMDEVDLATGAGLEELAAAACAREGLGDDDAAAVAAWARDCLATAPVREAAASPACYREMPFAVAVEDAVVNGKADLVYETAEGLVIVDYKTDEAGGAERAEGKYGDQMAIYAAALARVTARAVTRAYLVFPRAPAGERVVEPAPAATLTERGEALLGDAPRLLRDRARRENVG